MLIIDYTLQNNLDLVFIQETWIKELIGKYETSVIDLNIHCYTFLNLQRDTTAGNTEIMAIAKIYNPPRYEYNPNESTLTTEFDLYPKSFISQFKRWIIVGDINIHISK